MSKLPGGQLAVDDAPFPLWQLLTDRGRGRAANVIGPAKLTKTLDELECIRQAQAINERAMRTVRPRPARRAHDRPLRRVQRTMRTSSR